MESGQLEATLTPDEFLRSTNPMVADYVDAFTTRVSPRKEARDEPAK
jgi:hypothetical protein